MKISINSTTTEERTHPSRRSKRRRYTIPIGILLTISLISWTYQESTREKTIEQKIGQWIETHCAPNEECLFHMTDVTNFAWDRMVVFEGVFEKTAAEKILGIPVARHVPEKRNIVFLNNQSIVAHEDSRRGFEHSLPGEVLFLLKDLHKEYDVMSALFFAEKIEGERGVYYYLRDMSM